MPLPDFDSLPIVHNAIAIHTDGETSIAEFSRPQDWGDPRWMYRVYRISAPSVGYTGVFHCWIEQQLPEHKHLETFAPMFNMIMLPDQPVEECGRDFLREDDFWSPEWGEIPSLFEDEDDLNDWGFGESLPYADDEAAADADRAANEGGYE